MTILSISYLHNVIDNKLLSMNDTNNNTDFCIDSLLGRNDLFSDIETKEEYKIPDSNKNETGKILSNPIAPVSKSVAKEVVDNSNAQTTNKDMGFEWVLPLLAGAGGAYLIPKIMKYFKNELNHPSTTSRKERKKSKVINGIHDKRNVKPKKYEEEDEEETTETVPIQKSITDMNNFNETEFATIHQDFIITVAQLCNEVNIKLLLLNANERLGTLRLQFLYEKKNSYALQAIANIQKVISKQNEYFYFNQQ